MLGETDRRAVFEAVLRERAAEVGERVTPREVEVLYHRIVLDERHAEIAAALVISLETVDAHVGNAAVRLRYDGAADACRALFRAYAWAEARADLQGQPAGPG